MKNLTIGVLFAAMVILTNGCGLIGENRNYQTPTPTPTPVKVESRTIFAPKEEEFTKLPSKVQLAKEPYINGKVVSYFQVMDLKAKAEKRKELWVFNDNTGDWNVTRAQTPEEVGTVILQKCEEVAMGSFATDFSTEKIPGYGWNCEITIVDKAIGAVIAKKAFKTEMKELEMIKKGDKEIRRAPPYNLINDFISSLPKK